MVELLAPVGDHDALVAAVESGADAVYLAGKMFGARAFAPNFPDTDLAAAVRYAHLRDVLVYVTVNTLVDNRELADLSRYLQFLYNIGADAIILQDIGVAELARRIIPAMPLHASTQMTIHNLAGARYLAELGFKRIILARELSLSEIKRICENVQAEIEVFVHGALCICYSGQCLMSSFIGGRSGNRGKCAQPCRLSYKLLGEQGRPALAAGQAGQFLLSPKDLCTIDLLPELIKAGVRSLKIEGRMKRAEYVAVVVETYRRAINDYRQTGAVAGKTGENGKKRMAQIFNRGFTTAYLRGKTGRLMMSDRRPNNRGVFVGRVTAFDRATKAATLKLDETIGKGDVIEVWVKVGGRVNVRLTEIKIGDRSVERAPAGSAATILFPAAVRINDRVFKVFDADLNNQARSYFNLNTSRRRIPVTVTVAAQRGKPLVITLADEEGNSGRAATDFIAQPARNRPLTGEVVARQIDRLGSTPFAVRKLLVNLEDGIMVPISEINAARRAAAEELAENRLTRFNRPVLPVAEKINLVGDYPVLNTNSGKPSKSQLVANVDSREKAAVALTGGADIIMFGGECFNRQPITVDDYRSVIETVREKGKKIILNTPRLVKDDQAGWFKKLLTVFAELRPDEVSVANLGALYLARQITGLPLHGDYPLNIFNNLAVDFLANAGLTSLTLSPELNFPQIAEFSDRYDMAYECLVHGRLALMVSEFCLPGSYLGNLDNNDCRSMCRREDYYLEDRKYERFPIATDQFCRLHVFNAKELSMLPHVDEFSRLGIDRIRIEGKKMTVGQLAGLVKAYRALLDKPDRVADRQNIINSFEHEDITRGHYFRGVM